MNDEQTNKTDTKGTEADKPVESISSVNPVLSEARTIAQRIEEGNKKTEELLTKQEQLLGEQALAGNTGGNQTPVKKEITDEEYAEQAMTGELPE